MAILRRDDGVQFVLQPYRELLDLKSKSLLKKELQHLSESHGAYARIFKKNGNYEAIFARDSGFLLGEAIWQQLGQPNDLLYCEALLGKQQVLVVMVREGVVHLDTIINTANLTEELAFLLAEKTSFAIYIYGDAPISEQIEPGKFSLEEAQVKSFTKLHAPLYPSLVAAPELRLLPIERAIAELKLDQNTQIAMVSVAIIVALGLLIWWWQTKPEEPVQTKNPLVAYQTALGTPDPAVQLNTLAAFIVQAYNVPGWTPTKVDFSNGSARFELHTMGSSLTDLLAWADKQKLDVKLTSNGALLNIRKSLPGRNEPMSIINTQAVLAAIIDHVAQVLPGNNVKLGLSTPHGIYQETLITINLLNVSPQVLALIGSNLTGLPVLLGNNTLTLNNGLLTGTIQLSVLGN